MTYSFYRALGVALPVLSMLATGVICGSGIAAGRHRAPAKPVIPKTWDEKALAEWATPLARINVRPSHISSVEYYALPVHNLKTWPVYLAAREPEGYWQMLQRVGPQPMIEQAN